jgi:hypothetical protein
MQVFIVGFGKFGKKALPQVRRLWGKARIWIIDQSPEAFGSEGATPGIRVLADGPQFLTRYQEWIGDEDWIIPSLPIHLAWKWLDLNLKTPLKHKAVIPPAQLGSELPYSQFLGKGLFVSYATFVCPEHCPSPPRICFKTKEKRPVPLWRFLADQRCPKGILEVIESRQLAPGVGGFPFKELRRLLTLAQTAQPPFFVATACRCHGVIHGLTWE